MSNTPYRSLEVRAPRPPLRVGRIILLACLLAVAGAAAGTAAWRFDRTRRAVAAQEVALARAVARSVELAHAGTLGSGNQVTILQGAREHATLVRLPGRLVRRGTDLVREVEVLPAPGAVAVMPDGAWAIDSHGNLFDVSSARAIAGCARRPCAPQGVAGQGRVLQVTSLRYARFEGGSVMWGGRDPMPEWQPQAPERRVVDIGGFPVAMCRLFDNGDTRCDTPFLQGGWTPVLLTSALHVPEPTQLVATRSRPMVCVRGARGDVACGRPPLHVGGLYDSVGVDPMRLEGAPRTTRLALSDNDLCLVGDDGSLRCTVGPDRGLPLDGVVSVTHPLARVLEGVIEVAGLDAVEHLVASGDFICALQRGALSCWGAWSMSARPVPRPSLVATPGIVTAVAAGQQQQPKSLCVGVAGGTVRCWSGSPFAGPSQEVWRSPSLEVRDLTFLRENLCVKTEDSRVWCAPADGRPPTYFRRIPALDGFVRILERGLSCCAIERNPHESRARREVGLRMVYFPRAFMKMGRWDHAAFLLRHWQSIEDAATSMKRGDARLVQQSGRLRPVG